KGPDGHRERHAMKLLRWRRRAWGLGQGEADSIVVNGARKARGGNVRPRVAMTIAVFLALYGAIGGRLVYLGMQDVEETHVPRARITAARPDIIDHNGEVLATDIKTASLY